MLHRQPINDLSNKPNMDEKEERLKQPIQENVRHGNEEGIS